MDEPETRRVEVEREPVVERSTTVISTGERGGGGGTIAALVLLVAALVVLFLLFGNRLTGGGDETDIKVDIDTPELKVPDVNVPAPSQPQR